MNLAELGEITDSEYDKEHRCGENGFPDCDRLVHCISSHEVSQDLWQLHSLHFADETEVKIGEAEYVGEITYHSMILVNFCPFCGMKLSRN
ncbi:hypothetical protein [Mangrovitalea sediminis]|uniref:hypothetical protein n=1 Tax=Mangrovitalea sediminis TaxID=1982043 RepID=UPI000BE57695|nr:hypothetical protein [Mangrovitalea sediminis]